MTEHRREDYWRIDGIHDGVSALPLDGHVGPEPTLGYGQNYTATVRLSARSNSETGLWQGHIERYNRLLQYGMHAGQFTLHTLITGQVAYTETHTGDSLLISLTPPTNSQTGRGGYYLVSGVEDQTTLPEKLCLLEMDLTYLSPLDAYPDLATVQSVLEADGI